MSLIKLPEQSIIVRCNRCKIPQMRISRRINERLYHFSEAGKMWHTGRVCYDCYRKANQKYEQARRLRDKLKKQKEDEIIIPPKEYHDTRRCKKCGGRLETSRWLECLSCKPELPSDAWDAYIYTNCEDKISELPLLVGGAI